MDQSATGLTARQRDIVVLVLWSEGRVLDIGARPRERLGRRVFVTHETLEALLRGQLFGGGRVGH